MGGLKNVLKACKETGTIEKIIYTSSFFALGSTDGYVADESQVPIFVALCACVCFNHDLLNWVTDRVMMNFCD